MPVIPYIIAAVSLAAFLILWFAVVYRELSRCRAEMKKAAQVVALHKAACAQSRDGPDEKQAKKMLELSRKIYVEVCGNYKRNLRKPLNRFPAWLMGFRVTTN